MSTSFQSLREGAGDILWVQSEHGFRHGVTGGISVKAATDRIALLKEGGSQRGLGLAPAVETHPCWG